MPYPSLGGRRHCQPTGAVLGLGRVQDHPGDPELCKLWGRGRGSSVRSLRRSQNSDCFPGKCSTESSAWKGLSSSVKVTFAGDNGCLLWDVGRLRSGVRWAAECCGEVCPGAAASQTAQCQGDSWAGTGSVPCFVRVQISHSLLKPQRVKRVTIPCSGT